MGNKTKTRKLYRKSTQPNAVCFRNSHLDQKLDALCEKLLSLRDMALEKKDGEMVEFLELLLEHIDSPALPKVFEKAQQNPHMQPVLRRIERMVQRG